MNRFNPRRAALTIAVLTLTGFGAPSLAAGAAEPAPPEQANAASAACTVPSTHQPEVIKVVRQTGIGLNVSGTVMLAGFEAGWVESHMNNLDCGDRDSVGVFQQRPSAGWGTVEQIRYVPYAATKFFLAAKKAENAHPNFSAGEIAQEVQRSADPGAYDRNEAKARSLLDEARRLQVTEQHVVAQTAGGDVYHTLRSSDGWTPARNVEGQSGPIEAPITDVASVQVNGELHVMVVVAGGIYHAIRRATLGWTHWGNVERATETELGTITDVSAAEVNGELHVVAVAGNRVFHAIRHRPSVDGWTGFGNVTGQSELAGDPVETAAVGISPNLHVLAVVSGGGLFHTIRGTSGWQPRWGNVEGAANDIGTVTDVAASDVGSALHVVASNSDGGVFHAIRDPGWTNFGDVERQSGQLPGEVRYVTATGRENGELHTLANVLPGTPYHTIRLANGGWRRWGNVDRQVNYPDEVKEIDAG